MNRGESFSGQVRDPVTELVVMRRDKAVTISVKCMANREIGVAAVAVMMEVWRLWDILQE